MRKGVGLVLGIALVVSIVATSSAEQWQIVGPRALGMGGAHVAVVNDATASYWNPAAYGFFGQQTEETEEIEETEKKDDYYDRDWGIHIHGGAGLQLHDDIAEEVDDILNYNFDDLANKAEAGTITLAELDDFIQLVAEVKDLAEGDPGLTATADAGVNVRFKNFGIGGYSLAEIAASDLVVDMNNLGVQGADNLDAINNLALGGDATDDVLTAPQITQLEDAINGFTNWTIAQRDDYINALDDALNAAGVTSASNDVIDAAIQVAEVANTLVGTTGGNLQNNNSSILFKGAIVTEIPITYGYAFNDNFSLGGNLKFMRARVYYSKVKVFDQQKDDFFGNVEDSYEESNYFGIDLGALYKYENVRFGLVGRNLNQPKFDYAGPGDYKLDPQLRAGIAYLPASWVTLAADVDIIKNDTPSSSYDSQNLGGGIELKLLKFLSLRGGASANLTEGDVIYTAGLGIDVFGFNLDVGGAMSDSRSELDNNKVPDEARAELALSLQY